MNWLLIVVLAIVAIAAILGAYKGFLRLLFSLVAVVLLICLVGYAAPHVSTFIQTHTNIGQAISLRIAEKLEVSMDTAIDSTVQSQEQGLEAAGIHLPDVLQELLFEKTVDAAQGAIAQTGVYQQLGDQVAGIVVTVLSFVIALVIALLIVFIIGKMTDLANKIPVVKGFNRVLGFFAGIFLGFVIVWILFMLVGVMSGTALGQNVLVAILENPFLTSLYNENLLLKIIVQFLA